MFQGVPEQLGTVYGLCNHSQDAGHTLSYNLNPIEQSAARMLLTLPAAETAKGQVY